MMPMGPQPGPNALALAQRILSAGGRPGGGVGPVTYPPSSDGKGGLGPLRAVHPAVQHLSMSSNTDLLNALARAKAVAQTLQHLRPLVGVAPAGGLPSWTG